MNTPNEIPAGLPAVRPAIPDDVTIVRVKRTIRMYNVFENELSDLGGTSSIHWGFFGVAIGAAIAFGIVLLTVDLSATKFFAVFTGLFGLGCLATLYFLAMGIRDQLRARKRIEQIRERVVD